MLDAQYEKKRDAPVDSERPAAELGVSPNSVCLNLALLATKRFVNIRPLAGAGHSYCLATLTSAGKSFHDHPPKKLIFLSHAAGDGEMAMLLKKIIEDAFSGVDVFVSSAPENQAPGGPWLNDILNALGKATVAIILATDHAGKMRKGHLPTPFSFYTALNIDDPNELDALWAAIEVEIASPRPVNRPDFLAVTKELTRLCTEAESRTKVLASPRYARRLKEAQAGLSKLSDLQMRALHLLLARGEMTDEAAIATLYEEGFIKDYRVNVLYQNIETATGFVQPASANGDTASRWPLNPVMEDVLVELLAIDSASASTSDTGGLKPPVPLE